MHTYRATVLAFAFAVVASPVLAQVPAPDKSPPGTSAPSERSGENLSERLERSGGVIKPPEHADKDIHLTPPATGDNMNLPPSALPPAKNPTEKEGTPK